MLRPSAYAGRSSSMAECNRGMGNEERARESARRTCSAGGEKYFFRNTEVMKRLSCIENLEYTSGRVRQFRRPFHEPS